MARIIENERKNLIGENLKRIRAEKRLSQRALSCKLELLGVYICRGSISRIEDYSRTVTDIELVAIAKAVHVSVDELVDNSFFEL